MMCTRHTIERVHKNTRKDDLISTPSSFIRNRVAITLVQARAEAFEQCRADNQNEMNWQASIERRYDGEFFIIVHLPSARDFS